MANFKNPWELTPKTNPWEVGGGRSVLDREEETRDLHTKSQIGFSASFSFDTPKVLSIVMNLDILYKVIQCTEGSTTYQSYNLDSAATELAKFLNETFKFTLNNLPFTIPHYPGKTVKKGSAGIDIKINFTFNPRYRFKSVSDFKEIQNSDFIIAIVNSIGKAFVPELKKYVDAAAFDGESSRVMVVGASHFNKPNTPENQRLIAHEEGHRLGLPHYDEHKSLNLMSYYRDASSRLTGKGINNSQRTDIFYPFFDLFYNKLKTGKFGDKKGSVNVKNDFGNDPKQSIKDCIESAINNYPDLKYKI